VFDAATGGVAAAAYEYEPDEEEILAELLPRNIAVQIFRRAARERLPPSTARR
jgi:F-type H+-transporting ATPase subunit gamma